MYQLKWSLQTDVVKCCDIVESYFKKEKGKIEMESWLKREQLNKQRKNNSTKPWCNPEIFAEGTALTVLPCSLVIQTQEGLHTLTSHAGISNYITSKINWQMQHCYFDGQTLFYYWNAVVSVTGTNISSTKKRFVCQRSSALLSLFWSCPPGTKWSPWVDRYATCRLAWIHLTSQAGFLWAHLRHTG